MSLDVFRVISEQKPVGRIQEVHREDHFRWKIHLQCHQTWAKLGFKSIAS